MISSIGLRDPRERLPRWFGALSLAERERPDGGGGGISRPGRGRSSPMALAAARWSGRCWFDQASWLPDNLLERGDRMTMAASIEARMPFLDTELAALAATLEDRWRIKGFTREAHPGVA